MMLGHETVSARLEPTQNILGVGISGIDQDRRVFQPGTGFDAPAELESIFIRQVDIDHNEVETALGRPRIDLSSNGSNVDVEACIGEQDSRLVSLSRAVFNDQYLRNY